MLKHLVIPLVLLPAVMLTVGGCSTSGGSVPPGLGFRRSQAIAYFTAHGGGSWTPVSTSTGYTRVGKIGENCIVGIGGGRLNINKVMVSCFVTSDNSQTLSATLTNVVDTFAPRGIGWFRETLGPFAEGGANAPGMNQTRDFGSISVSWHTRNQARLVDLVIEEQQTSQRSSSAQAS